MKIRLTVTPEVFARLSAEIDNNDNPLHATKKKDHGYEDHALVTVVRHHGENHREIEVDLEVMEKFDTTWGRPSRVTRPVIDFLFDTLDLFPKVK